MHSNTSSLSIIIAVEVTPPSHRVFLVVRPYRLFKPKYFVQNCFVQVLYIWAKEIQN
jgi:hypothetical protein